MPRNKPSQFLPDPSFGFDETAVVLLRTTWDNYQFVSELNTVYNIELSRVGELPVGEAEYPCFSYYDDYRRQAYVVLERAPQGKSDASFDYYEKMLLVRGRDAWIFQQRLFCDLTENTPEPDPTDWLAHDYWVKVSRLKSGVFGIDTFGFSRKGTTTSLYNGDPEAMPRSVKSFLKKLQNFLKDAFEELQYFLSDEFEG